MSGTYKICKVNRNAHKRENLQLKKEYLEQFTIMSYERRQQHET